MDGHVEIRPSPGALGLRGGRSCRLRSEQRKTVLFITHSIDEALVLSDRTLVMTARPGRLKADIPVTLARPRGAYEVRSSDGYGALSTRLWKELREEVAASRNGKESA